MKILTNFWNFLPLLQDAGKKAIAQKKKVFMSATGYDVIEATPNGTVVQFLGATKSLGAAVQSSVIGTYSPPTPYSYSLVRTYDYAVNTAEQLDTYSVDSPAWYITHVDYQHSATLSLVDNRDATLYSVSKTLPGGVIIDFTMTFTPTIRANGTMLDNSGAYSPIVDYYGWPLPTGGFNFSTVYIPVAERPLVFEYQNSASCVPGGPFDGSGAYAPGLQAAFDQAAINNGVIAQSIADYRQATYDALLAAATVGTALPVITGFNDVPVGLYQFNAAVDAYFTFTQKTEIYYRVHKTIYDALHSADPMSGILMLTMADQVAGMTTIVVTLSIAQISQTEALTFTLGESGWVLTQQVGVLSSFSNIYPRFTATINRKVQAKGLYYPPLPEAPVVEYDSYYLPAVTKPTDRYDAAQMFNYGLGNSTFYDPTWPSGYSVSAPISKFTRSTVKRNALTSRFAADAPFLSASIGSAVAGTTTVETLTTTNGNLRVYSYSTTDYPIPMIAMAPTPTWILRVAVALESRTTQTDWGQPLYKNGVQVGIRPVDGSNITTTYKLSSYYSPSPPNFTFAFQYNTSSSLWQTPWGIVDTFSVVTMQPKASPLFSLVSAATNPTSTTQTSLGTPTFTNYETYTSPDDAIRCAINYMALPTISPSRIRALEWKATLEGMTMSAGESLSNVMNLDISDNTVPTIVVPQSQMSKPYVVIESVTVTDGTQYDRYVVSFYRGFKNLTSGAEIGATRIRKMQYDYAYNANRTQYILQSSVVLSDTTDAFLDACLAIL